ncbi:MAG TPA: hypothetical protein VFZ52_01810 [Chryseolinea sp.]
MRSFFVSLSGVNKALYFLFLCLSTIMVTFAGRTLLISDDLYFEFYGDQLSYERITEIVYMIQKWEWASYVLIPVYYLVKVFLVGICIYIGAVVIAVDISFRKIFEMALVAEAIFLVPSTLKLLWFAFFQTTYTLSEIQKFYPLSILNFFDTELLDVWLIYPLQLLNIFEIAYLLILAYGLSIAAQASYKSMIRLTACTYGTGLFIWALAIMFLTVTFSF